LVVPKGKSPRGCRKKSDREVNCTVKSLKNRGMKLAPGLSSDWLKLETANIPEVLKNLKNLKVCAVYVVAIF